MEETICLLVFLCLTPISAGDGIAHNCSEYVNEGLGVDCQCIDRASVRKTLTYQVTWPGHSNTSRLKLSAVTRNDNGSTFVCQAERPGSLENTTFTLQVAYGPSDKTMHIDGPRFFATDGSRNLTLTCKVDDVNPEPSVTWQFSPCNHGTESVTCTFQPQPTVHDGKTINCKAVNPQNAAGGTASFVLHLKFPPTDDPRIEGHTELQIHTPGDKLTCTVYGGQPTVSSVNFTCKNPLIQDQPDVYSTNSVSSTLVVTSSKPTGYETVCTCTAVWEPVPDLYPRRSTVSFAIQAVMFPELPRPSITNDTEVPPHKNEGGSTSNGKWKITGIVLIIAIVVIAAACIIVLVLWKKKILPVPKCIARHRKPRDGLAPKDRNRPTKPEEVSLDMPAPKCEVPGEGMESPTDGANSPSNNQLYAEKSALNEQEDKDDDPSDDQNDEAASTAAADAKKGKTTLPPKEIIPKPTLTGPPVGAVPYHPQADTSEQTLPLLPGELTSRSALLGQQVNKDDGSGEQYRDLDTGSTDDTNAEEEALLLSKTPCPDTTVPELPVNNTPQQSRRCFEAESESPVKECAKKGGIVPDNDDTSDNSDDDSKMKINEKDDLERCVRLFPDEITHPEAKVYIILD